MKCVLHCHSEYSPDSALSLSSIVEVCIAHDIGVVALTDHNEIVGAQELQKRAPSNLTVIVGEEISTQEGHLIGLFLKEKIEPHQSIDATIQEIRRQGGVVLLPHPFDRIRPGGVGIEVALRVKDDIDFFEIFNSRCLRTGDNRQAAEFALEHFLHTYVGADAHFASEYGNAICDMPEFLSVESFKASLRQATFHTRYAGWVVHLRSNYTRHILRRLKRVI